MASSSAGKIEGKAAGAKGAAAKCLANFKVAIFELEDWEKDYIKANVPANLEIIFYDFALTEKSVAKVDSSANAIAVFVFSKVTGKIIGHFPGLKVIATMSTGFDHIDLEAAKAKNVLVSSVPAYGDNTVAEHAFALLLAISRKLVPSIERTRKGSFSLKDLRGFDLKGKTVGVVGTGRIGQNFIRIANGFQMNVIAFDAFPRPELCLQFNFKYVSTLNELLANSDVISLHCPYSKETHHLLNSGNIPKIKRGAVLLNTARGGLVETEGLIEALKGGTISFAGLDVLEEEATIKEEAELLAKIFEKGADLKKTLANQFLLRQDNVLITPHNAFNSEEALKRILDTTIENISGFCQGKPCNVVNG